jgi:hypothetical protein
MDGKIVFNPTGIDLGFALGGADLSSDDRRAERVRGTRAAAPAARID